VSRLAEAYPMSFAAVQKHVTVLERAGLVPSSAADASSSCAPTLTPSAARGRPSMS
jgi:predicted transcriptional regulator